VKFYRKKQSTPQKTVAGECQSVEREAKIGQKSILSCVPNNSISPKKSSGSLINHIKYAVKSQLLMVA
jgi:hypothetical protein